MQSHEYADLFPMLGEKELQELADDIRNNGQHQPILKTEDGRILDGRNRLRACEIAGVQPHFKTFKGDDDEALRFVLSLNLTRRHLSDSQRAMIASTIATLRQGEKTNPQICGSESKVTQAAAAAMLNTSERQVQKATKVRREAPPDVVQSVVRGEMTLNAAERTTTKTVASKPADVPEAVPESVTQKDLKTAQVEQWFMKNMGNGEKGRSKVNTVLQSWVMIANSTKDRHGNPVGKTMVEDFVRFAAGSVGFDVMEARSAATAVSEEEQPG